MEETKWLEGQTMTIPIEKFIEMKIEMAELERENREVRSEKYELKEQLEEAHKSVSDYKKQLMDVLGVNKE